MSRQKLAVVLFNLGGPDGPDAVQPFLRNLFRDPAILQVPAPIREFLAWLISNTRAKSARENYAKMGGGSPIMPETLKQADALKATLETELADTDIRVLPAMRYWHPFVEDVVAEVTAWGADKVLLLPLYPQFSTTTTASSLKAWNDAGGPDAHIVCCYPEQADFVQAHADLIRRTWDEAGRPENSRLLFSAHGLPEKVVKNGDPYQQQVEITAAAVAEAVPELTDWQVCYQSRVGPLKWIGPSTEEAIEQAANDTKSIILTPIAFVSEHIETLVELDDEYAEVAEELEISGYYRVPALGDHAGFIRALAQTAMAALDQPCGKPFRENGLKCPGQCSACPRLSES